MDKVANKYIVRKHPTMSGTNVARDVVIIEDEYIDVDGEMDALRQQGYVCSHVYKDKGREIHPTSRIIISGNAAKHAVKHKLKHIAGPFYAVTKDTKINPVKICKDIGQDAELDIFMREPKLSFEPIKDQHYYSQWHLGPTFFPIPDVIPTANVHAVSAWGYMNSRGDDRAIIGILDDGIDLTLPDFTPEKVIGWMWFDDYEAGDDVIRHTHQDNDADPSKMFVLNQNHGTQVAGTALAAVNGNGCVGVAPSSGGVHIRLPMDPTQTVFYLTALHYYYCFQFFSRSTHIINMSIGSTTNHDQLPQFLLDYMRTLPGADNLGIVICKSAGNENHPVSKQPYEEPAYVEVPYAFNEDYTAMLSSDEFTAWSTSLDNAICVGATTSKNQRAYYSNYGQGLDVCAPSNNVGIVANNNSIKGAGIVTSHPIYPDDPENDEGVTTDFGGTSNSAPIVAGVAALIKSANPYLTAIQVIDILKRTCDKDLDTTPYDKIDYSSYGAEDVSPIYPPDFDENGWSYWFGYGKVNAYKAVRLAKEYT